MTESQRVVSNKIIPKRFILFVFSFLILVLFAVFSFKIADIPLLGIAPESEVLQEKELKFKSSGRTEVAVYDGNDKLLLKSTEDNNGFVAVVYSAIKRERIKKRVTGEDFLRLVLYENGRVAIVDDSTELVIHLNSFGEKNVAVFGSLFVK